MFSHGKPPGTFVCCLPAAPARTRCAPAVIHSTRNPFGQAGLNKLYLKCPDLVAVPVLLLCPYRGEFLFQHLRLARLRAACSNRIYVCRLEASTEEGCGVDLADCSPPPLPLPVCPFVGFSFSLPTTHEAVAYYSLREKKRDGLSSTLALHLSK